jgi:hypothetical protein
MKIFSSDSRPIVAWGPTATVTVRAEALGSVVDNSWILVNFSIGAREITDIRQCFDDVSYIYALGNNQAQCVMSLTFAIFIGKRNCDGSNNTSAIEEGLSAYIDRRISTDEGQKPSMVTIGGFSRMGWLTGMDIGNLDASKGVCYGTVNFIMELKKP